MNPTTVVLMLAGLVALSTALGLVYRATRSRVSFVTEVSADAATTAVTGISLGSAATLLQFSSEVCPACAATRRILGEVSEGDPTVKHVDIDVTDRPDLVSRFNILQTPTTLILDGSGNPVSRIGGSVRRDVVLAQLADVLGREPSPRN